MSTAGLAHRTWLAALGRLQVQIPRPSFDTWLKGTVGHSLADGALVISVPTTFAAEWLENRLRPLIVEAVRAVSDSPLQIQFIIAGAGSSQEIDKPLPPASRGRLEADLNQRFTFDSFVVGGSNQLAFAAASAVADRPGSAYNPLFLYGAVGLGKTHLLHAIAHRAHDLGRVVRYVTTEQFTNEFLASIRDRQTDAFRARYRSVDVLLVDDIQFLSGKEGTQEGFFHTFNALHDAGSQIVITSDRPAGALPLLEERLRSRLDGGLSADIGLPDFETRFAILEKASNYTGHVLPRDVLEEIAQRVGPSIRQLLSSLNKITALAEFTGQPITPESVSLSLGASIIADHAILTPKSILSAVATYFDLPANVLISPRRDKRASFARHIAMYLIENVCHLPADRIGDLLGHRDRSTVVYAVKKIEAAVLRDPKIAQTVDELLAASKLIPTSSPPS